MVKGQCIEPYALSESIEISLDEKRGLVCILSAHILTMSPRLP